jgi:hypothetical protein
MVSVEMELKRRLTMHSSRRFLVQLSLIAATGYPSW